MSPCTHLTSTHSASNNACEAHFHQSLAYIHLTGTLCGPPGPEEGVGAPATLNTCSMSIIGHTPTTGVPAAHNSNTPALASVPPCVVFVAARSWGGRSGRKGLVGCSCSGGSARAGLGSQPASGTRPVPVTLCLLWLHGQVVLLFRLVAAKPPCCLPGEPFHELLKDHLP